MKKALSLAVTLTLVLGLTLPAAAAEANDEALSRVTQAVNPDGTSISYTYDANG